MSLKRPLAALSIPSAVRPAIRRPFYRLSTTPARTPKPTPFVPDVPTFLTLIGRQMSQHAAKIPSWEALFSLSSTQLREAGVEPARARRYLLWWRDRFRHGIVGIGGDMAHVRDGKGEVRIVQVPSNAPEDRLATVTRDAGMRKIVVNTPASAPTEAATEEEGDGEGKSKRRSGASLSTVWPTSPINAKPVNGVEISAGVHLTGPSLHPAPGQQGVATLAVREGLWEQKRGRKIDGGERRRAEVRAKRRAQERRNAR